MSNRQAHIGDTVAYRSATGKMRNATVLADQKAAPAQPASSTSATGGTLTATTYSYRVSVVVGGVESPASVAKTQTTTGSTSTVTIDMTGLLPSNYDSFKVYGRTGGSELLMGTVTAPTLTFTDTGAATPSGALPTANGAVKVRVRGGGNAVSSVIPKQTSYKGTTVCYVNH